MRKMILTLEDFQMDTLEVLSKKEHRSPWQQASLIICQELERQGFITVAEPPAQDLGAADKNISKKERRT